MWDCGRHRWNAANRRLSRAAAVGDRGHSGGTTRGTWWIGATPVRMPAAPSPMVADQGDRPRRRSRAPGVERETLLRELAANHGSRSPTSRSRRRLVGIVAAFTRCMSTSSSRQHMAWGLAQWRIAAVAPQDPLPPQGRSRRAPRSYPDDHDDRRGDGAINAGSRGEVASCGDCGHGTGRLADSRSTP